MIEERYALFTRIPLYLDGAGGVFADDLWEKDLSAHLDYIADFRICCPVEPLEAAPSGVVRVAGLMPDRVFPLRRDRGWGSVAANLAPNFAGVRAAARWAEVAHSGGAGWAFPLSYYLLALRPFQRFRWIMVVESSFWMKPDTGRPTLRQRVSHHVNGVLVRRCVRAADARIFTQEWYREVFLGSREAALVAPAVWIDEAEMLDEARRAEIVAARRGPPRLLFPARLVPEKGVETVLAALERLRGRGDGAAPLRLDITGDGPLADRCRRFAAEAPGLTTFLDPIPYGDPFFERLRGYDGIVVANRHAEQPRVIYDAFAQGLPCLATRTTGNAAVVEEGRTGLLFETDDADALAGRLIEIAETPERLRTMGAAALAAGRRLTHRGMHREREIFLKRVLGLRGISADGM